jgi:hypothetical protein
MICGNWLKTGFPTCLLCRYTAHVVGRRSGRIARDGRDRCQIPHFLARIFSLVTCMAVGRRVIRASQDAAVALATSGIAQQRTGFILCDE